MHLPRFGWQPIGLRFETRGKGHGLGLCQHGANEMANQGKGYEEIFKYYYTGISIKEFEKPCKSKPLANKIIVVDPGHGGYENKGVIGEGGTEEKDIVLDIALKMKNILEELGAKPILTREDDTYVSLKKRSNISNELGPDFFISIHMNSFGNSSISGTEIYHYRGDKEGEIVANSIIEKICNNINTVNRGVKTADFYLLKEVKTSSIHIEVTYLTNPEEEIKLKDEDFREKTARSIADGIVEYYAY